MSRHRKVHPKCIFAFFLLFSCSSEESAHGWGAAFCDVTKGSINSQSQLVVNSALREFPVVALFLSLPTQACRPAVLTVRALAERCKPRAKRSTLETYRIFLTRSSNNNSAMATSMIRRRSGNLQTLLWKESVCLTCFHCMWKRGTHPSNIRL